MRILFCFLVLISFKANADFCALDLKSKTSQNTLVAIGYIDRHSSPLEKLGIGQYDYLIGTSLKLAEEINNHLLSNKYILLGSCEDDAYEVWELRDQRVIVINSHWFCDAEKPSSSSNSVVRRPYANCPRQHQHSERIKNYVFDNILKFDNFAYIGHARYGSGLSFGDFNHHAAKFKVSDVQITATTEIRLRRVFIGACKSNDYYKKEFERTVDDWFSVFLGLSDPIENDFTGILGDPYFLTTDETGQKSFLQSFKEWWLQDPLLTFH